CIKKDLVTTIKCQLAENHNVVLSIESINNKAVNENFKKVSKKITTRLSDIVKEVIVDKDISLILTGGDTAKAICESIGGKAIKLSHEIEEGLPIGNLVLRKKNIPIVTKAGGFGDEYTLSKAIDFISGGDKRWTNQL